jgi:hypothetical protein
VAELMTDNMHAMQMRVTLRNEDVRFPFGLEPKTRQAWNRALRNLPYDYRFAMSYFYNLQKVAERYSAW